MSIESLTLAALEFDNREPIETMHVDEQAVSVMGIARNVSHVDLGDRNDPTGYYGHLLDAVDGDVRAASRMLMDGMAKRS